LLVVDDDADMIALLERWLSDAGFEVHSAQSGADALHMFDRVNPDLLLSDLVMQGMDGLRLITEIHRRNPVIPVIMLSGQADIQDAMKAAHLGVSAFLTKPARREAIVAAIEVALTRAGAGPVNRDEFASNIIHRSELMRGVLDRARLVAAVDSGVLITGNTGTGKELLANAIHDASPRQGEAFVSINCSAIPDQLLESELFGHEKGAFTGATARHEGLFQSANGGTVFLDEIGDMPLSLQAKVLRVLQDFTVRPVGSTQAVSIDVRIISATHVDLETAVRSGEFREDLYYRLAVVPLHIPPLNERREDIGPIVDHLISALGQRYGGTGKRFAPEAKEALATASWPGNVRQLANIIEQCWVLSTSDVIPAELVRSALSAGRETIAPLEEAKRDFERRYLASVLRITNGNVSHAARIAGRNRTEFYKLINRHGLDPAEHRD
jgi:two-component system response regulator GlrR